MQYNIQTTNKYHIGSITRPNEPIFYCRISVDLHATHTLQTNAIEKIYTEMLLSGCTGYSRDAFLEAINLLGATLSVTIVQSTLHVTLQSSTTNAPKLLKLITKMLQTPTFAHSELKRVITQQTNSLIEYKENARALSHDNLINALYIKNDRRQSENPQSLIEAIAKITQKELKASHQCLAKSTWKVTCGTDEKTLSKLEACLHTLTAEHTLQSQKQTHGQTAAKQRTVLTSITSKQNIEFSIGASLPLTLHHPDYLPFVFGLSVLGKWGGFAGRLMSTVREKEGLTYGIYARTEAVGGTEQGHWYIMTFFSPEQALQGLQSTFREIQNIYKKGITEDEFKRFQTILVTQQTLLADSLIKSVEELHGYLCEGFTLNEMHAYKNKLLNVSQKEVNAALKKYLMPDKLTVSGAGPVQKIKKQLLTTCSGKV